jgi:hypothetical protein
LRKWPKSRAKRPRRWKMTSLEGAVASQSKQRKLR